MIGAGRRSWRDIAIHYNELPLRSAPFGQLILDAVPMRRGQAIIGIGAATGLLSLELAERCGPQASVLAVDPWTEALDVLAEQGSYRGLSNITVSATGAEQLDVPDDSIDVIVSNLGINNFSSVAEILSECHRVLRPGGTIVLSTNPAGHMSEFYEIFRRTLRSLAVETVKLDEHVSWRRSAEDLRTRMRETCFVNVSVRESPMIMRFADGTALLGHTFVNLALRAGWEALVPATQRESAFAAL